MGASAGGIESFHSFFGHMPENCGMAFIIILHLPTDYKSMLPEILQRRTTMRVIEATDGMPIEPDCVYVPPPHAIVTLTENTSICIKPGNNDPKISARLIDSFFDSLGVVLNEHAIGIVLSGTGSDGALGIKSIKESGGLTIAQGKSQVSGEGGGKIPAYSDMPAAAIATGAVDLILPVEQIPSELLRMEGSRLTSLKAPKDSAQEINSARLEICHIINSQLGHDFSGYRDKTFLRRVQRRMQVVNINTLNVYVERLKNDPSEVELLFRDLLIRVTSFFRDEGTFDTLKKLVIPHLFEGKVADQYVRLWVAGCATGEEAYSLAILLREHMDQLSNPPKVHIFATDIDDAAITTARLGRYPETLLSGLSPERKSRFFKASEGSFVVSNEIRDLCTFSSHNLVRDPPFSRMDLVSCRNLLIYLDTKLQTSIIPIFHYALASDGTLLLGSSESVSKHPELFQPLDKAARIFKRVEAKSPPLNFMMNTLDFKSQHSHSISSSLLTNQESKNIMSSTKIDQSTSQKETSDSSGSDTNRLYNALIGTREELQSLAEEHQTALEELRSSNEELHSVNEELHSTNEELMIAKDELLIVNEKLSKVNANLLEKVEALDEINADLRNLFDSTQIATIFVDKNLIIRSFTPAIAALYNLIPSDQGRPLTDIVSRLNYSDLRDDVKQVLSSLQTLERRISREDLSTHYLMRITPYRAPNSSINGTVITFLDVTSIVQAEDTLRQADVRKDIFLATLSHELRNPLAPIRTAAKLLKDSHSDPGILARVESIISRQVLHMSSLLDDLLDVSRITRGSFLLKKEYSDINEIIDAAVEEAQPLIDAKKHTIRIERSKSSVILEVDPVRITQVLSNLLNNAAKYTSMGGEIKLGFREESEQLVMYVSDNGIGISPETSSQVFNMFSQIKSDIEHSDGGLGIGLALAKGLVELHGGRIEVSSKGLGQGSEFIIYLPISIKAKSLKNQNSESINKDLNTPTSLRIVIADDNIDGAESMGLLLELNGHEVFIAHNGKDTLSLAEESRPEICILDIGMPDMSGYDVAKKIRNEAWGKNTKLIAVTGWGQENDKRLAHAAGFDHHMTKPVDLDKLNFLITKKD